MLGPVDITQFTIGPNVLVSPDYHRSDPIRKVFGYLTNWCIGHLSSTKNVNGDASPTKAQKESNMWTPPSREECYKKGARVEKMRICRGLGG